MPAPLLSVPGESQAAALYFQMRFADSANDDGAVQSLMKRTFSLSVSRAEVASSRSRILGSRMIALAMAMRCFWPRDNCEPCAPTFVSYF